MTKQQYDKLIVLIVFIFIQSILFGVIINQSIKIKKLDKQLNNYIQLIDEAEEHCNITHDCDCPWLDGDLYYNIIELNKELYHEN